VDSRGREFSEFFADAEPRLRRALVAAYGVERGREAAAEALTYAWEHWPRVRRMRNPLGYLYRVGQSRSRPRKRRWLVDRAQSTEVWVEPGLPAALRGLTERQRVAVVLVYGFGWTLREVAELTGLSISTIQNHLERGLTSVRAALEVDRNV
jgi:RNA polymerase sigma-70 factor (ECF subfamily)